MKISTSKTEVLKFSRISVQCSLQVGGVSLKQVEKFKCLGVAFPSDGKQDKDLDVRSREASAVMQALHHLVEAKLLVFKSIFVPIRTYGHESWSMSERLRSQMQRAK